MDLLHMIQLIFLIWAIFVVGLIILTSGAWRLSISCLNSVY